MPVRIPIDRLCATLAIAMHAAAAEGPAEPRTPEVRLLHPHELHSGEVVGFHPRVAGDWIGVGGQFSVERIRRGSLHLYRRQAGQWAHRQRLVSPAPGRAGDTFGTQFVLSRDTLAVGDFAAEQDGQVVGAVYLYTLSDGAWTLRQTLQMTNPRENAGFGAWIDIDGTTLIVGEAAGLLVGGWGDNRALHVFTREDGHWRASTTIERPASLVVPDERREKAQAELGITRHAGFGGHFDLDGERLVVSAMGADALLFYRRESGEWRLIQRIDDPGEDSGFARTVAIDGDILVVAALRGNGHLADTGVAHVYREVDGLWAFEQTLSLPNGNTLDMFGHWVAADRGTLLIGAHQRLLSAGLAYAYRHTRKGWTLAAVLNPPDAWRRRQSAYALDLDAGTAVMSPGNELLVGSPLQPPGAGGVYVVDLATALENDASHPPTAATRSD